MCQDMQHLTDYNPTRTTISSSDSLRDDLITIHTHTWTTQPLPRPTYCLISCGKQWAEENQILQSSFRQTTSHGGPLKLVPRSWLMYTLASSTSPSVCFCCYCTQFAHVTALLIFACKLILYICINIVFIIVLQHSFFILFLAFYVSVYRLWVCVHWK